MTCNLPTRPIVAPLRATYPDIAKPPEWDYFTRVRTFQKMLTGVGLFGLLGGTALAGAVAAADGTYAVPTNTYVPPAGSAAAPQPYAPASGASSSTLVGGANATGLPSGGPLSGRPLGGVIVGGPQFSLASHGSLIVGGAAPKTNATAASHSRMGTSGRGTGPKNNALAASMPNFPGGIIPSAPGGPIH